MVTVVIIIVYGLTGTRNKRTAFFTRLLNLHTCVCLVYTSHVHTSTRVRVCVCGGGGTHTHTHTHTQKKTTTKKLGIKGYNHSESHAT